MKACYCRLLKPVRPILAARLLRGSIAALVLAWNVNAWPEVPSQEIDALVERARREFAMAGIGLAIVKDDQPALIRGYGVRELGKPEAVDAETVFNIGSNTKAFNAASLALLVDEGKLNWDDPVTKHLPGFQMFDAWVTREMTVRDLLTHRSGLGAYMGDLLFWPESTFTREEIVYRQRFLRPATSFRSGYAYDNCLYIVAGEVLEAVSGKRWETFVQARLLTPLKMTHSSINREALATVENKAISHVSPNERPTVTRYFNVANLAPAGGINSCASDMARWMIALLGADTPTNAVPGFKPLLARTRIEEMWTAQTPMPIKKSDRVPIAHFSAYGLGFFLRDYQGHKMVWHAGGLPGQVSWLALIPDLNLGVALLTNSEPYAGVEPLLYQILDVCLGVPRTDWLSHAKRKYLEERAKASDALTELAGKRTVDSRPSLPLGQYAGTYTDAWYGDVTLQLEQGHLVLRFSRTPSLEGDLEHWQHDSFVVRWRDRSLNADAFVYFGLTPQGTIEGMKIRAISSLTDPSFDFQDLNLFPKGNRE